MGWTNATPTEMNHNILMRQNGTEVLTASDKRIAIYNTPSRKTGNVYFADCVVQIDVTVPVGESKTADMVIKEIVRIFRNLTVNKRPVHFDADIGDYTAIAGSYCHAVRFFYYSSI